MKMNFDYIITKASAGIGDVFFDYLTAPDSRGFFEACGMWDGLSPDQQKIQNLINKFTEYYNPICQAHIDCARLARNYQRGSTSASDLTSGIRDISENTDLPFGLLRDLTLEFIPKESGGGQPRPSVRELSFAVLLVDKAKEEGIVANLMLELMTDGNGELYHAPELAFVMQDEKFREAKDNARKYISTLWPEWNKKWDVRWRLKLRDEERRMPLALTGNSAGGTFALGCAKLLADHDETPMEENNRETIDLLKELDISGVAITATLSPKGSLDEVDDDVSEDGVDDDASENLGVVGGMFKKLLAAARDKAFPRIHTVMVSSKQNLNDIDLVEDHQNPNLLKDPHAEFHVIRVPTIAEAVKLLIVDTQTRWTIDCSLPSHDSNFVGRENLTAEVRSFFANHDSDYLVIVCEIGAGKSSWITEFIRDELNRENMPVYHIIDYHPSATGEPRNIAACLYSRLRRKYVFLEPRAWQHLPPDDRLELLLKYLSDTILTDEQKEVLYIDAADQANVSMVKPLLPGALRKLPRGVICVIMSRPDMRWLRTRQSVERWEMKDYVNNKEDVKAFLLQWTPNLSQPLSYDFINQIVEQEQPPVFFTVVYRLRQLEDPNVPMSQKVRLRTQPDLWVVPPEQLIETEAMRVINKASAMGITDFEVWQTLGVLAVAGEALSEEQLKVLGLWQQGKTDRILDLAANFFHSRPILRDPNLPYKFTHPGYRREVLKHLSAQEVRDLHCWIAEGCLPWRYHYGDFRDDYALYHLLTHLIQSNRWNDLENVLSEPKFIETNFANGRIYDIVAAINAAQKAGEKLERISVTLVEVLKVYQSDSFWRELHSTLNQFFGLYPNWPKSLRDCFENSGDFDLTLQIGGIHDMEGRHAQAVEVFEKMYDITGKNSIKAYVIAREHAAALRHDGRQEEAFKLLDDLINRRIANKTSEDSYWWCKYQMGITLRELQRYDEARKELEYLYKNKPAKSIDVSALHHLGVIDLELGYLEQAEEKFSKCKSLKERGEYEFDHRRAYDYLRLGEIYALKNLLEEARRAFDEAIIISRRCANFRYVNKTQAAIAQFLVAPYLKRNRPETISLPELASQFGIDESLLFSTDSQFSNDLNLARVPDGLRQKFEDNGIQLSDNVAVTVESENNRWLVTDEGNMKYIIRLKGDKLNIHDDSLLTDTFTVLNHAFHVLSQENQDYLEVIDAKSARSIGEAVRWDIAHSKGEWHAAVTVLIADDEGHIALQQRGERDSEGKWDASVTGHQDVGESDVSAAVRETKEELGVTVSPEKLIRVGKPYRFRKEGSPRVKRDRHKSRFSYVYHTQKVNRERVSAFILKISEEEKNQIITGEEGRALAVEWMTLSEAVDKAKANPEQFASAFKLLAHDVTLYRIRDIVESNIGGMNGKE